MFEKNPDVHEKMARLKRVYGNVAKGDFVPWSEFEAVMGNHRMEGVGWYVTRCFRNWMRNEKKIVTLIRNDEGIRFLTDSEAVREIPALRERKAYRQLRRGINELRTVDPRNISKHEQTMLAKHKLAIVEERKRLGRMARDAEVIRTPTRSIPKRPATRY